MKMKTIIKLSVIFFVIFSISYKGYSQITPTDGIVYVTISGTGNGSSWENATNDLQGAIDADGVTHVYVGAGLFLPTWNYDTDDPRAFSFRLKNNVSIIGSFPYEGGDLTEIDIDNHATMLSGDIGVMFDNSDNSYHVIYCPPELELDTTASVIYAKIQDGNADIDDEHYKRGGGIYLDESSPKFMNCIITNNGANRGAGIYARESKSQIVQCDVFVNTASETGGGAMFSVNDSTYLYKCLFDSNSASEGGGIAVVDTASPFIMDCEIYFNTATAYAGGVLNSDFASPRFYNCIIGNNSSANGGGILNNEAYPVFGNCIVMGNSATSAGGAIVNNNDGAPEFVNCNIILNTAPMGGGIANNNSVSLISNSIIRQNGTNILDVASGESLVTHSCIEGGYSGTSVMDVDPMLETLTYPNIIPKPNSPLVNAGINDSVPDWMIYDLLGNQRIAQTNVDIGVAEFGGIIYVDADASGIYSGTSWINAFDSFNEALNAAGSGTQIWVAQGTYKPESENGTGTGSRFFTFKLKPDVEIFGGFAGTENNIDQRDFNTNRVYLDGNLGSERVYHVVTCGSDCNDQTLLDGFTIRNGLANGSSSFSNGANLFVTQSSPKFKNLNIYSGSCSNYGANVYFENSSAEFEDSYVSSGESDNQGGGIALSDCSAKFSYCSISDNYAYGLAGGVNVEGSGVNIFNSCSFTENRANTSGSGGAVFVESNVDDLIFVNSYFTENIAAVSGGAIDLAGTAKIINCTFGTNYAENSGASGGHVFVRTSGELDIYNSVFTDGFADQGNNIYIVAGAQVSVANSIIDGCGGSGASWNADFGNDLGGNIDFDSYWSTYQTAIDDAWPGIDAGNNDVYSNISQIQEINLDADELPRFRGETVDIGHLEIPYAKLSIIITPAEVETIAEWSIDSWTTQVAGSGVVIKGEETVNVDFADIDGYLTPESVSLNVEWGQDYEVYGDYIINSRISDEVVNNVFSIYPNPATTIIFFGFENRIDEMPVQIFSADGKLIKQFLPTENSQVDLSGLSAGIYYVQYQNQTIKLVIQ